MLTDAERETIRQRVQSLLDGPFRLLGSFVPNHDCSLDCLMLDVQGAGFDQFYARMPIASAPQTREDLEPIRAFLREVEERVSRKLRGIVWAPHDPPCAVGETVEVRFGGVGSAVCTVTEVDREKDRIILERTPTPGS